MLVELQKEYLSNGNMVAIELIFVTKGCDVVILRLTSTLYTTTVVPHKSNDSTIKSSAAVYFSKQPHVLVYTREYSSLLEDSPLSNGDLLRFPAAQENWSSPASNEHL